MFAMPIIYLNLGGEMVYVLSQRLEAQAISEEKSVRVLQDICEAMFCSEMIEGLFRPQKIYTLEATKEIYEKLAHSSIMRLNKVSMDKLFDLMSMSFKKQILSCINPQDLIVITLNHLQTMKDMFVTESIRGLFANIISKVVNLYSTLDLNQWYDLKFKLLNFLQDRKVKISMFLQKAQQLKDGSLTLPVFHQLPLGTERPGLIRYYEEGNLIKTTTFERGNFDDAPPINDLMNYENTMGQNVYVSQRKEVDDDGCKAESKSTNQVKVKKDDSTSAYNSNFSPLTEVIDIYKRLIKPKYLNLLSICDISSSVYECIPFNFQPRALEKGTNSNNNKDNAPAMSSTGAKAELNMLADLLGFSVDKKFSSSKSTDKTFKLSLFPGDDDFLDSGNKSSNDSEPNSNYTIIEIDGRADDKYISSIQKSVGDWDFKDSHSSEEKSNEKYKSNEIDLLDLMDSVK